MAAKIVCTVLLLLYTSSVRGAMDINVDRLANLQSDLVRQTFNVIEEAIDAQHEMFENRIDSLERRVAELERIIAEGAHIPPEPAQPRTDPPVRPPVQPEPEPEPRPETRPEPRPEGEPEPTRAAPTTRRTTTTKAPTLPPTTTTQPPPVALPDPETCQDHYDRGETTNGAYTVDPKSLGRPFEVMCNFDGGNVQTVVHHDSEAESKNNGKRGAGSFDLTPTYNADADQLAALVDVSSSCQQFIKLRCKAAVLFNKKGTSYGWWIAREGETMRSWGGVPASMDSEACACSLTNSCASGDKLCNCDAASKTETSDEGLLTDKEYLPVQAVYLGDTGGRKQTSWLTLGELVCFGKM